ncbi:MAG: diacylglycerol kinase family lipid kinase [Anaerolineae bacterium]|nr:diacylglycerol kinase family lipid kinase [Anaerolineae bacterium]
MTYKATLIYNPAAGTRDVTRSLKRLATYLARSGWQIELVQTDQPGDAPVQARAAAEQDADIVLIAGGDGSINEAAQGLSGMATALGIVPVGTGNILAHQLRMPILAPGSSFHIREVGDALTNGHIQRVDLGLANGREFVCWAGLGLDAEIATQIEPRPRRIKRLRMLPYVVAGVSIASEFRGVRSNIVIGGKTFHTRALLAIASNIQLYAAFFQIAPQAKMDDGLLDIFVFKGMSFSYTLRYLVQSLGGRHLRSPDVMHALAGQMTVETSPAVAVHLDGEPYGCTPVEIGVRPGALRLLVPPHAPAKLFQKTPEPLALADRTVA